MKMRIALIRLLALTVLSTIMILAGGILNPNAATLYPKAQYYGHEWRHILSHCCWR